MSRIDELIKRFCPDGVVEYKTLGEIARDIYRGSGIKRDQVYQSGIPCVRYGEIYTTYDIWFSECKSHTKLDEIVNPKYFEYGDILFAITGESVEEIAKSCAYVGNQRCLAGGDIVVLKHNQNPKYLAYALETSEARKQKSAGKVKNKVVHSSVPAIKKISVPIPPLPVQEEIARILDSFTELEAELKAKLGAELEARKKQYEYYKNKLLSPTVANTVYLKLNEIANYRRGAFPQPYGEQRWYGGEGAMPFVQVADIAVRGMKLNQTTNQMISVLAQPSSVFVPGGTVIVSLQGSIGRVAITQYDSFVDRTIAIFGGFKVNINKRYFAYQLQRKFSQEKESARGTTLKTITKEEFSEFKIPVPPLKDQEYIVSILDRFDALCDHASDDIVAEIEARRKQYEYYRDKLLTFKELKA